MYQFPYDYVIERLGIKAYEADLPENIFGRMYFKEDNATVYRKFQPRMETIKLENVKIEPGTMLISKDNYFMIENGCYTMTITHEIVHWLYDQNTAYRCQAVHHHCQGYYQELQQSAHLSHAG